MKFLVGLVRFLIIVLAGVIAFFTISYGFMFFIPEKQYQTFYNHVKDKHGSGSEDPATVKASLNKEIKALNVKMDKLSPGKVYLVINTTENKFKLYKNDALIRTGYCSTGSLVELLADEKKSYRFETPKGVRIVREKQTHPVWSKPDWAFIEEGLPVPPPGHSSRYEKNVLGDYKLTLGDGYMIHGTLYQRLIGQGVTHGCVRLLDPDLEAVYNEMQIGSKVFIY
jgi:hypothetical protein